MEGGEGGGEGLEGSLVWRKFDVECTVRSAENVVKH